MAKTIGVAVDEETWLQLQHALKQVAAELGVERVTISVVMRQLINNWLGNPKSPFELGWHEGYLTAYGEVMRNIQTMLAGMQDAVPQPNQIGIVQMPEREV